MSRFLCLALMLFGLGGCGDTGGSATPAVAGGTCGEIIISDTRAQDAGAAAQAADCFVRAYKACTATSLTVQDTTNKLFRQFSILPTSSGCTLRQALQTDPDSPPAVADCEDASWENNTLSIKDCSHLGDFTLTP